MSPEQLRFSPTHEWVSVDGNIATIGISDFAVRLLTDIVFISLPETGRVVKQSDSIGEIESVKAVNDIYSPVDGTIIETNTDLPDNLQWLSEDAYGKAWIAKIRVTNPEKPESLMSHASYVAHCEHNSH
jgi:glycine cleavage system H protein